MRWINRRYGGSGLAKGEAVGQVRGMAEPTDLWRVSRPPAQVALWTAGYLAAQAVAFALTVQTAGISVFWPPAGVMLAALLRTERRQWPVLGVVLFVATMLANGAAGRGWLLNLGLSLNDIVVGAGGAWLYGHLSGSRWPLEGLRPLRDLGIVASVSALLSATIGAAIIHSAFGSSFAWVWVLWLGAMLLGQALVAPMILAASRQALCDLRSAIDIELAVLFAAVVILSALAFLDLMGHGSAPLVVAFAPVPVLVWCAVRRTPAETALLMLVDSLIAVWGTVNDHGPTVDIAESISARVLWLQCFLAIRTSTILLLCATIEARRRMEYEFREREARLRLILATVPEGIITIDSSGIVQSFSASAERLFAYKADEVVGRNVKMLMPPTYSERHDGYIARYLQTGERRVIGIGRVVTGRRKDGSTFPMELAIGEAGLDHRRIFTGFVRDISDKQETEKRLQELHSELLHVSRLSALGEFASALAHELNQPLAAIANYSRALKALTRSPDANRGKIADAIDKTIEQAGRAGQIIRRLRSFVDKGEEERQPEDVNKIVEEAGALALVGAKEKSVRVTMDLGHNLPPVSADKIQLQQVVINLIRNAMDAMQDTLRRELRVETCRRADGMIEIRVADTGPGIAPEIADRLFTPFATTKDTGMGIGLSISRAIAESHGGQLRHEPNDAGGATFVMTLPAVQDGTETDEQ